MLNTLGYPQECFSRECEIYCDVGVGLEKKIVTNWTAASCQLWEATKITPSKTRVQNHCYRGGMRWLLLTHPHLLMNEIHTSGEIKKIPGFNFYHLWTQKCEWIFSLVAIFCVNHIIFSWNSYDISSRLLRNPGLFQIKLCCFMNSRTYKTVLCFGIFSYRTKLFYFS